MDAIKNWEDLLKEAESQYQSIKDRSNVETLVRFCHQFTAR